MADRSQLVWQLYNAARERSEVDRAAFLNAVCADDANLRHEIESLLQHENGGLVTRTVQASNPIDTAAMALAITDAAGFQPGTVVGKRYRIVSLLGRGAMGEVYRADDLKVAQQVALKFLPMRFAADAERMKRFVSEVRLARQISHPNVCRVHDIGEADGRQDPSMDTSMERTSRPC